MARKRSNDDIEFGSDSFLDVLANMVGIMVILVMIMGVRVQRTSVTSASAAAPAPPSSDVTALKSTAAGLESVNHQLAEQLSYVEATIEARSRERAVLALAARDREEQLAKRRSELDAAARDAFDRERAYEEAKAEMEKLELQVASASIEGPVTQVETYPTPFAQTVAGQEAHFQIREGRIAHVPLDDLVALLKRQAQQKVQRLREQEDFTDTVGPLEGFRMRYTLERVEIKSSDKAVGVLGSYAQLREFSVLPVSSQLGETIDEALAAHSRFRNVIATLPSGTTVTLWTYPESFDDYHRMRKELHRLRFQAAGRPLPEGQPITGSPEGSRSMAQ